MPNEKLPTGFARRESGTQEMVDRYSHYSAAIVHDKLERESDAAALLAEIEFLIPQYVAAGGCMHRLRAVAWEATGML